MIVVIVVTGRLVFEIVVDRGALVLGHALLLPVHLGDLPARRGLVGLLVVPNLDEAGEAQADALLAGGVDALLAAGLVPRAERQVSRLDLPDVLRLEPDVGLVLAAGRVRVEGLGAVDGDGGELRVQLLEDLLREAGADVADRLVSVGVGVVAGQEEGSVDGRALALAIVGSEHDEVEGVAYAGQVVLLDLYSALI